MVLINVDCFDADDNEDFHADFNHRVGGGGKKAKAWGS